MSRTFRRYTDSGIIRSRRGAGILCVVAASVGSAFANPLAVQPLTNEFQVNTVTNLAPFRPSVATLTDDGFIVAWEIPGQAAGQRYDAAGTAVGGEFLITEEPPLAPVVDTVSVAGTGNGGFAAVWRRSPSAALLGDIVSRVFDMSGNPEGPEFEVAASPGEQQYPVTVGSGAGFVVTWADDYDYSIQIQATGEGSFQHQVSEGVAIRGPDVAIGARGGFVVVWTERYAGDVSVYGRLTSVDGEPTAERFELGSDPGSFGTKPAVGTAAKKNHLAVWRGPALEIVARPLNGRAVPYGPNVIISDPIFENNLDPDVNDTDGSGMFVVVWQTGYTNKSSPIPIVENGSDGDAEAIDGLLLRDGVPVGEQFTVNTYSTADQQRPAIARNRDGIYLVVWESEGSTGDDTLGGSIAGRFLFDNALLFRDGFELGNMAAWDGVVR